MDMSPQKVSGLVDERAVTIRPRLVLVRVGVFII